MQGGSDVIKGVLEALEYRLHDLKDSFAGAYDPSRTSRSREDVVAVEALKKRIRHCKECGTRGTLQNGGGRTLSLCARCAFLEFRDWVIHSKGFSQELWRLPPKGSPVSSEKMTIGPTHTLLQDRHPEMAQEIIESYDRGMQYISEWGPNQILWSNFVGGLMFYCDFSEAKQGAERRLNFKPTEQWNDSRKLPAEILFGMWKGEQYLNNVRTSPHVSEAACLRIVGELVSEQAEKQWTAPWLVNPETQALLYVDGYFPKHHLAVEHHGKQHFEPVEYFGGEASFESGKRRDEIKAKLLTEHGIKLLVVRHDQVERDTIAQLLREVL